MKAKFTKRDANYALVSFLTDWRSNGGTTVSMDALCPVFLGADDSVVLTDVTVGEVLDRLLEA